MEIRRADDERPVRDDVACTRVALMEKEKRKRIRGSRGRKAGLADELDLGERVKRNSG